MSFSSDVKKELAQIKEENACCQLAEISGFIRACGTIKLSGPNQIGLRLLTENSAVARHFLVTIKRYFQCDMDISTTDATMNKHHNVYELTLSDSEKVEEILVKTKILISEADTTYIDFLVPKTITRKKCCKKAYIRGFFLGGGSMADPKKSYHLELVTSNESQAKSLRTLINTFQINAKVLNRNNSTIVYIKDSEKILDFLNIVGAHHSWLAFEEVRMMKEIRNQANRLANCDEANITRTIQAAGTQIEAIHYIIEKKGLHYLPEKLRDVAVLRLENREESLQELAEMIKPPISKSGLRHRLNAIVQMAKELKEDEERK